MMEVSGEKENATKAAGAIFPHQPQRSTLMYPFWELMPGRESWWLQLPETLPAACMHLFAPKSSDMDQGTGRKQCCVAAGCKCCWASVLGEGNLSWFPHQSQNERPVCTILSLHISTGKKSSMQDKTGTFT